MTEMDLEATNFRNMVTFFEPELRRIMRGSLVKGLLADGCRRQMVRCGILTRNKKAGSNPMGRGGSCYILSLKAVRIIEGED